MNIEIKNIYLEQWLLAWFQNFELVTLLNGEDYFAGSAHQSPVGARQREETNNYNRSFFCKFTTQYHGIKVWYYIIKTKNLKAYGD